MAYASIDRYNELRFLAFTSPYRRTLEGAQSYGSAHHPSCGDELRLSACVTDGIITDIAFTGAGCIISQAAAALLVSSVHHKKISEINFLCSEENILSLLNIDLGPTRRQCATLVSQALQDLIKSSQVA